MVERIIDWSLNNRFLVILLTALAVMWGIWSMQRVPLDAIPDLSDTQVIVYTEWGMNSPDLMEDQVTYPVVSALLAAPRVKNVRGYSYFGTSFVYVIFEDGVDIYWARTRVLEYLDRIKGNLPEGANPVLGPDATGVGWGFQYALVDKSGKHSLADLRALQDWTLRYALESVQGVAEVATVGGFEREYQVTVDPNKLLGYGLSIEHLRMALRQSNADVGGRVLEFGNREYMVRGRGYIENLEDIRSIVLRTTEDGTPVTLGQVAVVREGPAFRRGAADYNGQGEAVGGIVVVRFGENVLNVIERVKTKIDTDLKHALPEGVELVPVYDRSELINNSIDTLRTALFEEVLVVSLVILIFLLHFRSSLTPVIALPIAVLLSFIPMKLFAISSNIMSLGGIALAIGVLVDASLVMLENSHRRLAEGGEEERKDLIGSISRSCKQVGRAIFFSLLIMVVSFLPVFLLEAQEGRMFKPLAWTKTFAIAFASLLAITLVPVLMTFFLKGKLQPERKNPVSRFFTFFYKPVIRWVVKHPWWTLAINFALIPLVLPMAGDLGKEFMPELYEGSVLYMPTTLPGITLTEASRIMQVQDEVLIGIPEVERVFGKVGRANTSTDPAPVTMWETTITLKPEEQWRPGVSYDDIVQEMNEKLSWPGITNSFYGPIKTRIDMLTTGIRTPVGIKVYGDDLNKLQAMTTELEQILKGVDGTRSAFGERATNATYLDIRVNREEAARHGVRVKDVENLIRTAIGGMEVTTILDGRERYGLNLRLAQDFRDTPEKIARIPLQSGHGNTLTLDQVADIQLVSGPGMIKDENGKLTSWVYVDVKGRSLGEYVEDAKATVEDAIASGRLHLPAGYFLSWSGQYEYQIRAKKRLRLILPAVGLVILVFLFMVFRSWLESLLVMLGVAYSLTGGVILQWWLGYNWSVAVWVGYIALFGVAVETGVVMVVYLHEALDKHLKAKGKDFKASDVLTAAEEGAVLRLRPKLMTVGTTILGLMPIMFSTGAGSDVMKPIAAPIIGGMVTSTLHVLVVTPVLFVIVKRWMLKRGTLKLHEKES